MEPLPVLISRYMFCSTQLAWPCPQTASDCWSIVFLHKAAVIEKLSLLVHKHLWDEDVEHELWQVWGVLAVGERIWTKWPSLISAAHPGLHLLSASSLIIFPLSYKLHSNHTSVCSCEFYGVCCSCFIDRCESPSWSFIIKTPIYKFPQPFILIFYLFFLLNFKY